MRLHKNDCYEHLLQKHKNNIKGTWSLNGYLNVMIKNHSKNYFPTYFVNNDNSVVENAEEIANEFHGFFLFCCCFFFVNVGPNLAREFSDIDHNYGFAFNNNNSVFLGGVCESDVLEVVRKSIHPSIICTPLNPLQGRGRSESLRVKHPQMIILLICCL